MSVLIKGMKMPENCVDCKLADRYSPNECPFYTIYKPEHSCKRFNKCPLVEVPTPHGRLIDERVAYDKIGGYYVDIDAVDVGLQETPTVIEAEDK